jgi:hypothetical protein
MISDETVHCGERTHRETGLIFPMGCERKRERERERDEMENSVTKRERET